MFGSGISKNCSLKELSLVVEVPDCLCPILNGLSVNTSILTFSVSVGTVYTTGSSNLLGQCLEKCFTLNHFMNKIDFALDRAMLFQNLSISFSNNNMIWLPAQVSCICTGLCANTSVVTLDISGCHIDTEACDAVCGMLSHNTTLKHLFLNPVHLEKQEAVTMIDSCRDSATLELLSLVQWPPKRWSSDKGKASFHYSCDPEIKSVLLEMLKLREDQKDSKPVLNVYWLVATYIVLMCIYLILSVYREYDAAKGQILPQSL